MGWLPSFLLVKSLSLSSYVYVYQKDGSRFKSNKVLWKTAPFGIYIDMIRIPGKLKRDDVQSITFLNTYIIGKSYEYIISFFMNNKKL